MWSSASPRRWAAATAISSRSLTFAWPVKSEKRDGRNVSSNAASGLFNVEIDRSAIARENARTPNQRQGERGELGFLSGHEHDHLSMKSASIFDTTMTQATDSAAIFASLNMKLVVGSVVILASIGLMLAADAETNTPFERGLL